jgi:threonine/homoserine/homoserine lactone efflux protein
MDAFALFTVSYLLAAAAPGADTMLIVSRTIVDGWRSALRYAVGISLAKTVMVSLAFFGVSALLTANPAAYTVLKFLGAGFLIFMAVRLWRSKAVAEVASEGHENQSAKFGAKVTTASILGGFLVGISNPQPLLFYTSIIPMVVAAGLNTVTDLYVLWAIVIVGFMSIAGAYIGAASTIRPWLAKQTNRRRLNQTMAVVFGVIAAVLLLR